MQPSLPSPGVVYEVNLEADAEIAAPFDTWLRDHIADVLQFNGFLSAEILGDAGAKKDRVVRILAQGVDGGEIFGYRRLFEGGTGVGLGGGHRRAGLFVAARVGHSRGGRTAPARLDHRVSGSFQPRPASEHAFALIVGHGRTPMVSW